VSTDPDLDAGSGGGAEPVAVWTEAESIDCLTAAVQRVQVLAFVQVPQHRLTVLDTTTTTTLSSIHHHSRHSRK